jgi:hypothetical protein
MIFYFPALQGDEHLKASIARQKSKTPPTFPGSMERYIMCDGAGAPVEVMSCPLLCVIE